MGPATLAEIPLSDSALLQGPESCPLRPLPSPADNVGLPSQSLSILSIDDDVDNPTSPLWTPRPSLMPNSTSTAHAFAAAIRSDPVSAQTRPLPPSAHLPMADTNFVAGDAPASSRMKSGPGLRLPSFKSLGIAAPHHDPCFDEPTLNGVLVDDCPMGGTESLRNSESAPGNERELSTGFVPWETRDPVRRGSDGESSSGRAVKNSVHQFITTLTPPAELDPVQWAPMTILATDSPDAHSAVVAPTVPDTNTGPELLPAATSPLEGEEEVAGELGGGGVPQAPSWIDGAVQSVLNNLQTSTATNNPVRILSHALPSPSSTGHIYPSIISSMHEMTPASPTIWINVFHAIPGRFNLADLPTSPPATPGPAVGGEDYFTQKVFDSAVPISDYQTDLSSLPRSPRPVVPPSSINVSVVERYIPPTSVNEFADMFNTNGPSILVDRLVELSPHNGSLVFIYPTRTGAQTFMKQYLGPVLDPIIRSMVVVNGLSSDLGIKLGNMASVDRLPEHDDMHRQMVLLCDALSARSTNNTTTTTHAASSMMQQSHFHGGRRGQLELTYVAKREVILPREVWARDWWTKQEKPRVKDVVTQVALEAQRKSSSLVDHSERTAAPAELIQQLLDNVCRRAYVPGNEPERGVEVSVFVIKRSS